MQDDKKKAVLVNILSKSDDMSSKVQAIFKSMQQESQAEPFYTKKRWKYQPTQVAQWVAKQTWTC